MNTKESKVKKYCCFYASDFHLEMILLPYIKNNIYKDKFIIFTEENLSDSIKVLLSRTNLNLEEKNLMLNLDWKEKNKLDISKYKFDDHTIIINGSSNYIDKINQEIRSKEPKKINIIDCYSINDKNVELGQIEEKYDGVLNTSRSKKI